MDYLHTVTTATTEVRHEELGDGVNDQAALLLIGHAAGQLAAADPVWSLLALDVLAVGEQLHPDPAPILLDVEPPAADNTDVRTALATLLIALADRYERASGDPQVTTARGLALAESAIRLRGSAALLS